MSEAERKETARRLYADGIQKQEVRQYDAALASFRAAQKLVDAPTHLLHIAQCLAATGKLVEAADMYETLRRVPLGPASPPVFIEAQAQGVKELAAVRESIPLLRIEISPSPEGLRGVEVLVNEVAIPVEVAGVRRPVNPGDLRIVVRAEGHAPASLNIKINEKDPPRVASIKLERATGISVAPRASEGDRPLAPSGRIGFGYAPVLASAGGARFESPVHNIGADWSPGSGFFRYHVAAFVTLHNFGSILAGFRLEPATFGVALPVFTSPTIRVEIEPAIRAIDLMFHAGSGTALYYMSSGIDARVNVTYKSFLASVSPAGLDVRYLTVLAENGGVERVEGIGIDYRIRIMAGFAY